MCQTFQIEMFTKYQLKPIQSILVKTLHWRKLLTGARIARQLWHASWTFGYQSQTICLSEKIFGKKTNGPCRPSLNKPLNWLVTTRSVHTCAYSIQWDYSFCTYMCLQHTVRLLVLCIHVLTAYSKYPYLGATVRGVMFDINLLCLNVRSNHGTFSTCIGSQSCGSFLPHVHRRFHVL